jgi:hypothetical protein
MEHSLLAVVTHQCFLLYALLGWFLPGVRLVYTWSGLYMEHTGCHHSVLFTMRPTRVVTPGCGRLFTWSILAVIS